jgi:hypothetical protein
MAKEIIFQALKALLFVIIVYLIFLFIGGQQAFVYEGF